MAARSTVVHIGAQVGTGALAAGSAATLGAIVTAIAVGLTIGKGGADPTQTEETSKGCGDDGFEGVAA